MKDDYYKLAGTVKIPEARKEEFNRYVIRLLDRSGIRKTRKITVAGKEVMTAEKPRPDKDGIVRFNYSIFERSIRQEGTYDTDTCQSVMPNRGCNEYGLAMNLLMTMQEAYSNGACYLLEKEQLCTSTIQCAAVVKYLLGINLDFPGRARLWDMALFLRKQGYQTDYDTLIYGYFEGFNDKLSDQLMCLLAMEDGVDVPKEPIREGKGRMEESDTVSRQYYAMQLMKELMGKGEEKQLEAFLQKLLEADIAKRGEMAEANDGYGILSEISLYELPPMMVSAYAAAKEMTFWEAWDELNIEGYSDLTKEGRCIKGAADWYISYYKAIFRKNEDEFLGLWDEMDLQISKGMMERIADWQLRYREMTVPEGFAAEPFLAELVEDLTGDWNCRIPDRDFVEEFAQCRDEAHSKALLLLRELMEEDTKYFPELTRRQAMRWILRNHESKEDFIAMSAFCSVMTAHEHRRELFGF